MDNPYGKLVLDADKFIRAGFFSIRWIKQSIEHDAGMEVTMLLNNGNDSNNTLKLRCHHVVALKLGHQLDYNHGIGRVMVYDISEFQTLGCRYHVREAEDEGFDFLCHEIEFTEETVNRYWHV